LLMPVLEKAGAAAGVDEFPNYAAGAAGPERAGAMIQRDGRSWMPIQDH
jgi:glucose-6-phosphate 1-dehydrogenase